MRRRMWLILDTICWPTPPELHTACCSAMLHLLLLQHIFQLPLYSHHNHKPLVSNPMAPPKLHNACCSAPASASAMQHFLCQTPMALTSQSHGTYITITLAFTSQWHGAHITITLALTSQSHAASRHLYCTLLLTCNSFSCATHIALTSNGTHIKSHHIHM